MHQDFTPLLTPISPENPAGDNLEYDPLFDDIRQARESDADFLPHDEWAVSEPRKADWNRVRELSEQALATQSKDLQLACWFTEALCHQQGISGLLTGMKFLNEFITRYWFLCWPQLEDDGITMRRSRLLRLDRDLSLLLSQQPVLRQSNSSLLIWRQILAFEHKINCAPETRDELIHREGDLTMSTFNQQAADFSSIEISQQASVVDMLSATLNQIETQFTSLSQNSQGDVFTLTRQTLEDLSDFLRNLAQRAIPAPVQESSFEPILEMDDGSLLSDATTYAAPAPAPIAMNRALAIEQMLAIANYFREAEPSSPVPFLMERAARWADMAITDWLEEMLNDKNSINEINNVLTGQPR